MDSVKQCVKPSGYYNQKAMLMILGKLNEMTSHTCFPQPFSGFCSEHILTKKHFIIRHGFFFMATRIHTYCHLFKLRLSIISLRHSDYLFPQCIAASKKRERQTSVVWKEDKTPVIFSYF